MSAIVRKRTAHIAISFIANVVTKPERSVGRSHFLLPELDDAGRKFMHMAMCPPAGLRPHFEERPIALKQLAFGNVIRISKRPLFRCHSQQFYERDDVAFVPVIGTGIATVARTSRPFPYRSSKWNGRTAAFRRPQRQNGEEFRTLSPGAIERLLPKDRAQRSRAWPHYHSRQCAQPSERAYENAFFVQRLHS